MGRGRKVSIASFLSPSADPVPLPAEPITTTKDLVCACFAKHPDRWLTCAEVTVATGLTRERCASVIDNLFRQGHLERNQLPDHGRRMLGQTYRWVA